MAHQRQVICPTCGHSNHYPDVGNQAVSSETAPICRICHKPLQLDEHDYQDVVFVGMDDGYHSWYSQPTSYHTRYRCANVGAACAKCVHAARHDIFCHEGRIDVRRMRRERFDGSVYYDYHGWIEEG